jgi:putative RNA 2'-phosphotransferase
LAVGRARRIVLRACPAHGAFDAQRCPTCQHRGQPLLVDARRTLVSKYLSGALRHFPDDVGLAVDERGWASLDALVAAACETYEWVTPREVRAVLALDCRTRCA